jgi:hypothetical protein
MILGAKAVPGARLIAARCSMNASTSVNGIGQTLLESDLCRGHRILARRRIKKPQPVNHGVTTRKCGHAAISFRINGATTRRWSAVEPALPSFYPLKKLMEGRTVKLGVSRHSEMVAVDAIVVYFQSTPNFPSWTVGVDSAGHSLEKTFFTIERVISVPGDFQLDAHKALLDICTQLQLDVPSRTLDALRYCRLPSAKPGAYGPSEAL